LLTALQHCVQEITKGSETTKLRGGEEGEVNNDRKGITNPTDKL
jgi:hypothetical protein